MTRRTELDPRYVKMALVMAGSLIRRLPHNVLLADLKQAALMGLVDGLRRHPGGSGPGYECYLRWRIRGSMLDELRQQDFGRRRRKRTRFRPKLVHFDDLREDWQEVVAGAAESPEDIAIRRVDAAKAWSTPLDPIDARVLRLRYEKGIQQDKVAELEQKSPPRISQRETRGLARMRHHLTAPRRIA